MHMITENTQKYLRDLLLAYPSILGPSEEAIQSGKMGQKDASELITATVHSVRQRWQAKPMFKQNIAAQALWATGGTDNSSVAAAMSMLKPGLGKIKGLTFTRNVNGTRVPLSPGEQREALVGSFSP
jgi:hypothetical protein